MEIQNQMISETKVKALRKRNRILEAKYSIMKTVSILSFGFGVMCLVLTVVLTANYKISTKNLSDKLESTQSKLSNMVDVSMSLVTDYSEAENQLKEVSTAAVTLSNQDQKLKAELQKQDTTIKKYEERAELFDKYEYALIRSDGTRTDITYKDIYTLQDLISKKGMNDDTLDLVLALAMNESNGKSNSKNSKSTAAGFGGILEGTGDFIYTDLMGNESYNHYKVAMDGTTNLKMMVYYLDYLADNNSSISSIVDDYRGLSDTAYKKKLNKYLSTEGESLASLSLK